MKMRNVMVAAMAAAALLGGCASQSDNAQVDEPSAESQMLAQGIDAFKAGDLAAAEASWNEILKRDPNDPYANLNMGALKAVTNRTEEAVAHYKLAAENGERSPIVQTVSRNGTTVNVDTTVSNVARENVSKLQL